jgi:DNA-binding CsgD family transcriptional regulator
MPRSKSKSQSSTGKLQSTPTPSKTKPKKFATKPRGHATPHKEQPIDSSSLWNALAKTPGVGVSITDAQGHLLFVNSTTMMLFSETTEIDYEGKRISDFHPPDFVKERLRMIQTVLKDGRPLTLKHIYHGRNIHSTVWPIVDRAPPYSRVIVVSFVACGESLTGDLPGNIEAYATNYIDLGPLDVLTQRELEVLVLLGHGMSVPKAAKILHRSPKTVQRHKAAISQKLELHGQAELVSLVASLGLELSHIKLKRLKR